MEMSATLKVKVEKKDLLTKTNIATMATEVANETDGHTF